MTSMPNIPRIKKTLQNLEFLVVQDAYADVETTKYATSIYRPRCGAKRKACSPIRAARESGAQGDGAARGLQADLWIFNEMARRFERGRKIRFPETSTEVFDEIASFRADAC